MSHEWTLRRIGFQEPSFALQSHLTQITVGRAPHHTKQLLASCISRDHAKFCRVSDPGDPGVYWNLVDVGSSTKTYLNSTAIQPKVPVRLNDRDLVAFGSNANENNARGKKYIFYYEVRAPVVWGQDQEGALEDDETVADDAETPPGSPSDQGSSSRSGSPSAGTNEGAGGDLPDVVPGCSRKRSRDEEERPSSASPSSEEVMSPASSKKSKIDVESEKSSGEEVSVPSPASPSLLSAAIKMEEESAEEDKSKPSSPLSFVASASNKASSTVKLVVRLFPLPLPRPDIDSNRARLRGDTFAGWVTKSELKRKMKEAARKRVRARRAFLSSSSSSSSSSDEESLSSPAKRKRPARAFLSSSSENEAEKAAASRDSPGSDDGSENGGVAFVTSFSQKEEVIVIDSDSEYYQASQSFVVDDDAGAPDPAAVKEEPEDDDADHEERFFDGATLGGNVSAPARTEDDGGEDDDVCLSSSQLPLFQLLSKKIKIEPKDDEIKEKEKSTPQVEPEPEKPSADKEDDDSQSILNQEVQEGFDEPIDGLFSDEEDDEDVSALLEEDDDNVERRESAGQTSNNTSPLKKSESAPAKLKSSRHVPTAQRKIQEIDPLPQRPRQRGRLQELKDSSEDAKATKPPKPTTFVPGQFYKDRTSERKDSSEDAKATKPTKPTTFAPGLFYKSSSETRATGDKRFAQTAGYKTKADIAAQRKQRLQDMASRALAKREDSSPDVSEDGAGSSAPAKVKQSEPKAARYLSGTPIKPTRQKEKEKASAPVSRPPNVTRSSIAPDLFGENEDDPQPSTSKAAIAADETRRRRFSGGKQRTPAIPKASLEGSTFLEDVQRRESEKPKGGSNSSSSIKMRRTAETIEHPDGNRTIAKLTFGNTLSNVCSQDLWALSRPSEEAKKPEEETPTASKSASEDSTQEEGQKSSKNRKKKNLTVTWRKEIADIRYIPLEGNGLKVGSSANTSPQKYDVHHGHRGRKVEEVKMPTHSQHGYRDMLKRILEWNTLWLQEQDAFRQAPPVQGEGLKLGHVPPVFASYNDYCLTYYPLLLLELWRVVYNDYQQSTKDRCPSVLFCPIEVLTREHCTEVRLLGLLTEAEKRNEWMLPSEGYLIKLDLRCQRGHETVIRPTFAYVTFSRVRRRRPGCDEPYAKMLVDASIPSRRRQLEYAMEVRVMVKRMKDDLAFIGNKPIVGKGISRISPTLRQLEAVEHLKESPLFGLVMKPKSFFAPDGTRRLPPAVSEEGAAREPFNADVACYELFRHLNEEQAEVVKKVAAHCINLPLGPSTQPRPHLSLIQGPPGTGKTSTIAALVLQIFSKWRQKWPDRPLPRILLTAPSNAAVDEMSLRIRKTAKIDKVKILRIGQEKVIHPEMRNCTLEFLRDAEMARKISSTTNANSIKEEIKSRQENLNLLGQKLEEFASIDDRDNVLLYTRKIKEETDLQKRARSALDNLTLPNKEADKMRREVTDALFKYADIVATTLTSSMNGQMQHYFFNTGPRTLRGNFRPFSVCIMDEASQCVEPEAIIPLRLGFSKLVLVGDPEQLPATVSSVEAKENSLNVSLFSRAFRELQDSGVGSLFRLKVQYRMHSEIVRWPNRYIYGGVLTTGPQDRGSPLPPYTLFNLHSKEKHEGSFLWNDTEAKFVCKLVREILTRIKEPTAAWDQRQPRSISVITFYARQVHRIKEELKGSGLEGRAAVRTVDGFQGSESDIVIISCVRSKHAYANKGPKSSKKAPRATDIGFVAESERLNVALTRARYALFVVGNFSCLKAYDMWKDFVEDARDRKRIAHVDVNSRNLLQGPTRK